ncbi:hypothetical protein GCM10027445_34700 [Amycolatopsis endophytica]
MPRRVQQRKGRIGDQGGGPQPGANLDHRTRRQWGPGQPAEPGADAAVFLASGQSSFVNGAEFLVDDGLAQI